MLHVEDDIDDFPEWRSVLVFYLAPPRLVLAEATVIPAVDRRRWLLDNPDASPDDLRRRFPAGEWSRDPEMLSATGDGIPGRLFRHIKVSAAQREVRRYLRGVGTIRIEGPDFETFDLTALAGAPDDWMRQQTERPRSAGREELFHATWARRYVDALSDDPRRPAVQMASRHGVTPKEANYFVQQARNHSMLTSTVQGRAGGTLTDKAVRCLERAASGGASEPQPTRRQRSNGSDL